MVNLGAIMKVGGEGGLGGNVVGGEPSGFRGVAGLVGGMDLAGGAGLTGAAGITGISGLAGTAGFRCVIRYLSMSRFS